MNDIPRAKQFYGETLGLNVTEENGMLMLHLAGGGTVLVYPKENHEPATFTILNFPVPDVEETVDRLTEAGVPFEHYEGATFRRTRRGSCAARDRRSRGSRIPPATSSPYSISRLIGVTELAIRLRGAVKRYGAITAVDGLDLDVPEGTCVGLLGPNGAGKSTTMRLLTAQSIADEGEIEVLGFKLPAESKMARAQCGVVPQLDNLDVTLTVEQNLLVFAHLYRIGRAERRCGDRAGARDGRSSSTAATRASTSSPAACGAAC